MYDLVGGRTEQIWRRTEYYHTSSIYICRETIHDNRIDSNLNVEKKK